MVKKRHLHLLRGREIRGPFFFGTMKTASFIPKCSFKRKGTDQRRPGKKGVQIGQFPPPEGKGYEGRGWGGGNGAPASKRIPKVSKPGPGQGPRHSGENARYHYKSPEGKGNFLKSGLSRKEIRSKKGSHPSVT